MKKFMVRHRQVLVRSAIYGLMTLTVIVTVTLLMLVVLGYSYNNRDGRLEQGGLLQFQSIPTGATVTLDGSRFGSLTNTKTTIDTGTHNVSFDRRDYRTWKKSITIKAGQIGWLNYARLVPTTVTPKTERLFGDLTGALASPKSNFMLLHEAVDVPAFELADIQGDTIRYTTLTLPEGSYTVPGEGMSQRFEPVSWSYDEQSVLIRHIYDNDKTEWIWLDRDSPESSTNISAGFGIQPSKIVFAGKGSRLLFVQTEDAVRRINLDDQTLSRPLATKVSNFTVYDDKTITFATVTDDKSQRSVGYAAVDIQQPQTIATFSADNEPLMAAMATYFNQRYVMIVHGTTLTVQTGTLPTSNSPSQLKTIDTVTVPAETADLQMTVNGRFAQMLTADGYAVYDIEMAKFHKTIWVDQTLSPRPLMWLDEYMVWSDHGGTLRFYDFDGANQQAIMSVTEGFSASISPNGKYIYGVEKTDKGFEFKRAQLIL